jgi:hypothetical protein
MLPDLEATSEAADMDDHLKIFGGQIACKSPLYAHANEKLIKKTGKNMWINCGEKFKYTEKIEKMISD